MKIIAILAVLICMFAMFKVKREYKGAIMILGSMLFTLVDVPGVPLHGANMLIPLAFLISEFGHFKRLFRQAQGTVIWKLMGVALLMSFLTIITSPHVSGANPIRYFIQGELLFKYFALLYAFWTFGNTESLRPTLKLTFAGMLILTAIAAINYLTKSADFVGVMMQGREVQVGEEGVAANQMFTYSDRFRVQAMFSNPFDYGYMCVLMILLHLYGWSKKMESKGIFLVVLACALFGVVTCGCRTILLCAMVGVGIYMLTAYKLSKSAKYCVMAALALVASYSFVPIVQEQVDKMATMFEKNSDVGGSSLELRALQYGAVLYHIQDSPLFGCGYGYFNLDLGWADGQDRLVDKDLAGLEGVVMNYLLERGVVGLTLYLIFYISLIVYCFKRRNISRETAALGLSVLAVYLAFANMTGELLSVYPTLLMMGFVVKVIESAKITPPRMVN